MSNDNFVSKEQRGNLDKQSSKWFNIGGCVVFIPMAIGLVWCFLNLGNVDANNITLLGIFGILIMLFCGIVGGFIMVRNSHPYTVCGRCGESYRQLFNHTEIECLKNLKYKMDLLK